MMYAEGQRRSADHVASRLGPPTTAGKFVQSPQSAEEWNQFITRYSLGELHSDSFALPSLADTGASDKRQPSASTSLDDTTRAPSVTATQESRRPSTIRPALDLASRQSSGLDSDGQTPAATDAHPDTSTAGPSNQDPDIPNIPSSDLPAERVRVKTRSKKGKEVSQGGELTVEKMRQLNLGSNSVDVETGRTGDASSKKRSKDGQRRPRIQAELATRSGSLSSSEDEDRPRTARSRPRLTHRPRSKSSWVSRRSRTASRNGSLNFDDAGQSFDAQLLESTTTSSASVSQLELNYDQGAERARIREFYERHGYMPAPRQPPDAMRRRLRVIRRLGLEHPEAIHRESLDRFTRLASSIFKTRMAMVSIMTKDRQIYLSQIGCDRGSVDLEQSFCGHTIVGTGENCLVVQNASHDWRFMKNPQVDDGRGPAQFYAGAPLVVGSGARSAVIGSLCIVDDKPREFTDDQKRLLLDLSECVVSELELLYSQQAVIDSAKLHQIAVDFLRRSLKNRPTEQAGVSLPSATSSNGSDSKKRTQGADRHVDETDVDIYDEASREIRMALDAFAVAVVDLSQFHLFYPAYQSSSTAGSSTRGGSTSVQTRSYKTASTFDEGSLAPSNPTSMNNPDSALVDEGEQYARSTNIKRARKTYAMTDASGPSRTPQVLFIPDRSNSSPKRSKDFGQTDKPGQDDQLAVLGYSCETDGFAFNFTSSPAARKIISDFIASNVKTRRVWYTRDDSEGIAASITHLMPPGTETSMAMPVFGFDGQVAFAVVACWTDPLYSYPSGAMQFVETIAGSLLASVMKERLHKAERAQLNFAAAASHELRTPLHQINAAASLLRSALDAHISTPAQSPAAIFDPQFISLSPDKSLLAIKSEDRIEVLSQLEIIEANGSSLGHILENIIDTLDIGRLSSRLEERKGMQTKGDGDMTANSGLTAHHRKTDFAKVLEEVVNGAVAMEAKARRVSGGKPMDEVEVILEMTPRPRGGWLMTDDSGPLARALGKIIHNACKFTEKGYIHVSVQDVSRDVVLPAGYDNSIKSSIVSIDIKDSGRGMSPEFLENEILRPFAKADPFMPGAGLGLGLAQRMVEILGGKLAIASTLNKGTLVHVEIPLHLLNEDNESDQDDLVNSSDPEAGARPRSPIRQDGLYLVGFDAKDPGVRRVGKSLVRTLKQNACRIVTEIQYAALIIASVGVSETILANLAREARPNVQIIILGKESSRRTMGLMTPGSTPSADEAAAQTYLHDVPTIYLARPLRPSIIARIIRPSDPTPTKPEKFISPVVGGDDPSDDLPVPGDSQTSDLGHASDRRPSIGRESSLSTVRPPHRQPTIDDQLLPSPKPSPRLSSPLRLAKDADTIPLARRPEMREHATDPLPVNDPDKIRSSESSGSSDDSGSMEQPLEDPSLNRPVLKEARSEPVQVEQPLVVAMKVLVVEDNAINRKILVTMLKRTSCQYIEAIDGQDAVTKFLSFQADLVLLDINMPRKDGFAAAAEMRQIEAAHKRKRAHIIAVTAMSGEAQKRRGILECGIDEWKVKPISIGSLREEVERLKVA